MLLLIATAHAGGLLGDDAAVSAAICAETNRVRALHGLRPLAVSDAMHRAAQLHADQMVAHDFFGHTAPDDAPLRRPLNRLAAAGITTPHTPAENIATWFAMNYRSGDGYRVVDVETFTYRSRGYPLVPHTPESFAVDLVAYWMDSPGHRVNILSDVPEQLGCAAAMYMQDRFPMYKAVQVFL